MHHAVATAGSGKVNSEFNALSNDVLYLFTTRHGLCAFAINVNCSGHVARTCLQRTAANVRLERSFTSDRSSQVRHTTGMGPRLTSWRKERNSGYVRQRQRQRQNKMQSCCDKPAIASIHFVMHLSSNDDSYSNSNANANARASVSASADANAKYHGSRHCHHRSLSVLLTMDSKLDNVACAQLSYAPRQINCTIGLPMNEYQAIHHPDTSVYSIEPPLKSLYRFYHQNHHSSSSHNDNSDDNSDDRKTRWTCVQNAGDMLFVPGE